MLIRPETAADVAAIRAVTRAAFTDPDDPGTEPVEPGLVDELRADPGWLPPLSLVAVASTGAGAGPGAGEVIGHVVCTRGRVGSAPALGLGPLSVHPDRQRAGVGSALVHAVLAAADTLAEPLVALLGDPGYYARFGFEPATEYGIEPPIPAWAPHFQVRTLTRYDPALRGVFRYAAPFDRR